MSVAQTSMEAYLSLGDVEISERQEIVLEYILAHPDCTAEDVYLGLGYSTPNSTSPRITELLDLGILEVTGRKVTASGRSAMTYRVRDGVGMDPTKVDARPLTQWSKTEIIRACQGRGMPEASIEVLRRMSLEDVRATVLVLHDTRITGSHTDPWRTRHTRFWVVDYDFVRGLSGQEDGC